MAPTTAGFWRVCSWNVASAAASWKQNLHILHHLHRFLRLSTSILIHPENTGWRWLKKMFTGLLVQVAKRFQVSVSSGECVGDPEWTPTRSSQSSIVVSTDLSPYRQSTPPVSLHFGYFRMMQVTQDGRRYTQQQVPGSSNVFVPCLFHWMFYGHVWESEETFNRSSRWTLPVWIMVEECFAIHPTMGRWREHAPSSLHRQYPRRHDIIWHQELRWYYHNVFSTMF